MSCYGKNHIFTTTTLLVPKGIHCDCGQTKWESPTYDELQKDRDSLRALAGDQQEKIKTLEKELEKYRKIPCKDCKP